MSAPPSMQGYWQCCNCGREVHHGTWGDECPDCSPSLLTTTIMAPTIERSRSKKQVLHLYLNDHLMKTACADTGSLLNCMSKAFANKIGLVIMPASEDFGLPIKGRRVTACGIAQVFCRFPKPPFMERSWQFYVFDCLSIDVICGLEFLRITETKERYPHRLHDFEPSVPTTPKVCFIGHQREYKKCWLNATPVLAFPDTGADVSMISAKFAGSLGYCKGPGGKSYNDGEPIGVTLADGSSTLAVGAVDIIVSLFEPDPSRSTSISSVERLADTNVKSSKSIPSTPTSIIIETFHVFDSLDEDAILSETLLAALDCNQHIGGSYPSVNRMQPGIAVAARRKRGEGSGKQSAPLSEEEKFQNEFWAARDAYVQGKQNVADQLLQGEISTERAPVLVEDLDANHRDWARRNKASLDKYFLDYYDTVIPRISLVSVTISGSHVTWVHEPQSDFKSHTRCEYCTWYQRAR